MKKIALLTMLLCLGSSLCRAQERVINPNEITYHQSIELNVGCGSLTTIVAALNFGINNSINWGDNRYGVSNDCHILPAINLNYGKQLTPLINLGVILGYAQAYSDVIDNYSGEKGGYWLMGSIALLPTVRFDWLRLDMLRC